MDIAFAAIGLEIPNETAFNNLAEDAKTRGEASHLARKSGVLHGRCWRLGAGLEVWTMLYESATGEVSYADCRPGFRARFQQKINPWVMTEFAEEGEALVHGFIEDSESEVLFALQNLTEASQLLFQKNTLTVGLCGLAHYAEIAADAENKRWKAFENDAATASGHENVWTLCGEILAFKSLRNPFSGSDVYWMHLDVGSFKIEILVNQRTLQTSGLAVGAMIKADVWLQGHIIGDSAKNFTYEGVDYTHRTVDFWRRFKKEN